MKNLKRTIAIVCGGDSSEHDVSMRSAQGLYSFFDKERYDVYIVDVKDTDWHVNFDNGDIAKIDRNDFSFMKDGKAVMFDYAYITIHGTPGENGLMQGYFDLIKLPYSTSNVLVEALTFDKFVLNNYLRRVDRSVNLDPLLILAHQLGDLLNRPKIAGHCRRHQFVNNALLHSSGLAITELLLRIEHRPKVVTHLLSLAPSLTGGDATLRLFFDCQLVRLRY